MRHKLHCLSPTQRPSGYLSGQSGAEVVLEGVGSRGTAGTGSQASLPVASQSGWALNMGERPPTDRLGRLLGEP